MKSIKYSAPWLSGLVLLCLVFGVFFSFRSGRPVRQEEVSRQISSNLNDYMHEIDRQASRYIERLQANQPADINRFGDVDFLVLRGQQITHWTSNQHIPGIRSMLGSFTTKYSKTAFGDIILRKWEIDTEQSLMAMLPLRIHYRIQNEYLELSWNKKILGNYSIELYEPESVSGTPVYLDNHMIFRFTLVSGSNGYASESIFAALFFTLAFMLLAFLLYRYLSQYSFQNRLSFYLLIIAGIIALRLVMILLRFPARFLPLDIYDPNYFASSDLNPSLADLLTNLIFLLVIGFLVWMNSAHVADYLYRTRNRLIVFGASMLSGAAILFCFLFPYVVIQTVYNNSGITLSIAESLTFDSIRIAAIIVVLLSWVASFLFIHFFSVIVFRHDRVYDLVLGCLSGSILFVLINELSGQHYIGALVIGLVYGVVIFLFRLYQTLDRFHYLTFIYLFISILAFAAISFEAVNYFGATRHVREQTRFAGVFLIDRDDFGEYLLTEAADRIGQDLFIQTRLAGPFINKEAVRQKIRQVHIPGYFNRYTIQIHLFGTTGQLLDEPSGGSLEYWLQEAGVSNNPELQPTVYYMTGLVNDNSRKFISIIPVKRNDLVQGYVVLVFTLKRVVPDNVYPELLIDNRFQQAFQLQDYSYAIYSDEQIQIQSGNFNYAAMPANWLSEAGLYASGKTFNDYRHVALKDPGGRVVVVSAPLLPWSIRLADFSFWLIGGLISVLVYLLIIGIQDFFSNERLLLSARIQIILNLSFFIPLIIVSIITLGMTARNNMTQLNVEYLNKSQNFSRQISAQFPDGSDESQADLENRVSQLLAVSNLDANIFAATGRLIFTSQPMIFENQLLSPVVNPIALSRIQQGERSFVLSEHVGKLNYFVAYSAILSPRDGSLVGIAALPFFQSASLLEKMQIVVLANILLIFTVIFILLLVVFYWLSSWLTFPLRMITRTLGRTNLTTANQPLEWNSNDEIGLMVSEYNQMLSTLSENKSQLERSQREMAWREIAQQVAHEIKNPLTPIKLTLQNLERLDANDPTRQERFKRAIETVLAQVDILNGVASSFSTFAKMPEPVLQPVELIGLIRKTIQLHQQSVSIEFSTSLTEANAMADEQLLKRVLSNLILNASQSARKEIPVSISVTLERLVDIFRISVADNGTGIPDDVHEKIFMPHFSTKQAGSGLGLAIARQGIEQMGGKIYFKSQTGVGSVFYIELPQILSIP
jgi:two-component system, NtrC family, nitrogen regulation sensor histidine kinase NtrY